jgi:hypothetical protein
MYAVMHLKDPQVKQAARIPRTIENLNSNESEVYASKLIKSLNRSKKAYSEKLLKFQHILLRTQARLLIV